MKITSFWIVLMRLIGLYFLFSLIVIAITSATFLIAGGGGQKALYYFIFGLILVLGLAILCWKFLILRPDILIQKFKLTTQFEEEEFRFPVKNSNLIKIGLIVLGGLTMIDGLTGLLNALTGLMQGDFFFTESPEMPAFIQHLAYLILGYFLVFKNSAITGWIERETEPQKDTLD